MRITDGINPLDQTGIHPESYDIATNLLKKLDFTIKDLGSEKLKNKINTCMEVCIFKIMDIYNINKVISIMKDNIKSRFSSKGKKIIDINTIF